MVLSLPGEPFDTLQSRQGGAGGGDEGLGGGGSGLGGGGGDGLYSRWLHVGQSVDRHADTPTAMQGKDTSNSRGGLTMWLE